MQNFMIARANAPTLSIHADTLSIAVQLLVREARHFPGNADLVSLRGAQLANVDLTQAYLPDADLREANLTRADLRYADLSNATLYRADLTLANLTGADLTDVSLTDATLTGAILTGATMRGALLTLAQLQAADLSPIRADFWDVLTRASTEVDAVEQALRDGKVDGRIYDGPCACLVGTIANARHCKYDQIPGLAPNVNRPAETWFLAIAPGDIPDHNPVVAITLEWIAQWRAARLTT